jgi:hypothetical protein
VVWLDLRNWRACVIGTDRQASKRHIFEQAQLFYELEVNRGGIHDQAFSRRQGNMMSPCLALFEQGCDSIPGRKESCDPQWRLPWNFFHSSSPSSRSPSLRVACGSRVAFNAPSATYQAAIPDKETAYIATISALVLSMNASTAARSYVGT